MPPKKQITKEQIIETAYHMVKIQGVESLSVRNLAAELKCSTQPIYFTFRDMNELKSTLGKLTIKDMEKYIVKNQQEYKDIILGNILGYVEFAYFEKNLYQLMYSSGAMTMNQTKRMVAESTPIEVNMMIYANGLVMMNSFGTSSFSWEQTKKMILGAYRLFSNLK